MSSFVVIIYIFELVLPSSGARGNHTDSWDYKFVFN